MAVNSLRGATDPISRSILDAKGDIITATADNVPSKLALGTDGFVSTADSTQSNGLKWAAAAGSAIDPLFMAGV